MNRKRAAENKTQYRHNSKQAESEGAGREQPARLRKRYVTRKMQLGYRDRAERYSEVRSGEWLKPKNQIRPK